MLNFLFGKNEVKTIYDKIIFINFLLVLITYPFAISINSIAIICLVFFSLLKLIKDRKIYPHKVYILFFLFFLIRLFSLLYTENMHSGGRAIERSLSLLIFPFVFLINKPIFSNTKFFFRTLNISTLIACLFCLFSNYHYFITNDIETKWWLDWKYNNHYLSSYLDFGPNYFSVLIVVNLVWMYFYKYNSAKEKLIFLIIYSIQFLFLFLLSSRSIILFFLLSTFVIISYKSFVRYKTKGLLITLLFFLLSVGFMLAIPVVKQRFKKTYKELFLEDKSDKLVGGYYNRTQKIKSSIAIIKKNYIFGVGIGDVKDELKKEYINIDFTEGIKLSYDAHNQYLQSFLASGILGLLSFCSILIAIGLIMVKRKEYFYLFIILLYSYFSLIESLVETHKGVVLFSILLLLVLPFKKSLSSSIIKPKN